MSRIYHLVRRADWDAAGADTYHGSADDTRDGFLHFSTDVDVGVREDPYDQRARRRSFDTPAQAE